MRKIKFLSIFMLLALLVSTGPSGVMSQEPPATEVPARVPSDQVPEEVNVAGVSESVLVLPAEGEVIADCQSESGL